MGGSGGWAVGVEHPWLLRLALDEVLCAGPVLHGGHLHDGMWGIPAQRGGPPAGLPKFSLSRPQLASHQGELSPSHEALDAAFSLFTQESVISSPVACCLVFLL